jgi:hypothetical protein
MKVVKAKKLTSQIKEDMFACPKGEHRWVRVHIGDYNESDIVDGDIPEFPNVRMTVSELKKALSFWREHAYVFDGKYFNKPFKMNWNEAVFQRGKGDPKYFIQDMFNKRYPDCADKVVFTDHAAQRILQRFGHLNSQTGRAICKGIRELRRNKKRKYHQTGTYQSDIVLSRDSGDGKFVVITGINKVG